MQDERIALKSATGELHPGPVPMDELLRTVGVLAAFPPGDRLRLDIDCQPGLAAWSDRLSVTRILVNLLQNARQALERSASGGGHVSVHAAEKGDHVVVEVRDDGPGIPEELRDKVFEEFFTTRDAAGGSGLGLATASELAKANGGVLELPKPQPPRGALFRLELPTAHVH